MLEWIYRSCEETVSLKTMKQLNKTTTTVLSSIQETNSKRSHITVNMTLLVFAANCHAAVHLYFYFHKVDA